MKKTQEFNEAVARDDYLYSIIVSNNEAKQGAINFNEDREIKDPLLKVRMKSTNGKVFRIALKE